MKVETSEIGARSSPSKTWAVALLVSALGLLLLVPLLGQIDFHHEEGRRVLPAREMLTSGNWIVPTLWERPYLSKPPGIYWMLAASFSVFGEITTWSARAVSVASTWLTLLGLLALGRKLFGLRAGTYAALLFLACNETLTKGRLAEIEAALACTVLFAIGCWWFGRRGSWGWTVASGCCLAAAVLLKGPAALVFFLGPPVLLAFADRRPRDLLSPRLWVPLSIGLAVPGLWVLMLFEEIDAAGAANHWSRQIGGQGGPGFDTYLTERLEFLVGTVLTGLPATWLLLASLGTPEWQRVQREPKTRFALSVVVVGWLFFAAFPGTNVRYFHPTLPWLALLAGALLQRAQELDCAPAYSRRVARIAAVFLAIGVLASAAAGLAYFRPIDGLRVDGLGVALAALLLALVVFAWPLRGALRSELALIGVPLVAGLLFITQVESAKAVRHAREPQARRIDAELRDGEVLQLCIWSHFDTLLYLQHEVRLHDDWHSLAPGQTALMTRAQGDELRDTLTRPGAFEELLRLEIRGAPLDLIRIGPGAASAEQE